MARLYSDENIPLQTVEELRRLSHDVLTAQEAGKANQRISVLATAIQLKRAVLSHNRWDYIRLHSKSPNHCGIVVCSKNTDFIALARRIHDAIVANEPLDDKLIRVTK
jgi:hypothetical protein